MASCGGLVTRLPACCTQQAKPIDNRPQATTLPHKAGDRKIVAARKGTKM
jgi:hypothetical protein